MRMRISEASAKAGVSARLLRYYEEQGLLAPSRDASGYRRYSMADLDAARHVRQLLDAGLSTATIRQVLPCLVERAGRLTPICSDLIAQLEEEQQRIESSISALTESRDAIASVIAAADPAMR
ncbi:MerR family transcriptional regulator [Nocardioides cheoyonin]|uniref:MerR family transcriptional regulator n=1 Tax=Nocardioides cheoyonin TaxID=3156615 RepID=UPI0032B432E0